MSQDQNNPVLVDRARLAQLERPENLRNAVSLEKTHMRDDYDCMSCRIMGASAFMGLGAYTYWSGHRQLRIREKEIVKRGSVNMAARRLGITGTATLLVGLGLYRFFA